MKEFVMQETEELTTFGSVWKRYEPVAELVRCKKCKHCEYPTSEKEWCKKGHLHGNAETWFCADGERRDDDD